MLYLKKLITALYRNGRFAYLAPLLILGPELHKSGYLFFVDFSWGPSMHSGWANSWHVLEVISNMLHPFFPAWFFQKLVILVVLVVLITAGRKLAAQVSSHPFVIGLTGIFLVFNPFTYIRLEMGQLGTLLGVGFLLLSSISLITALRENNPRELFYAYLYAGLVIYFAPYYIFALALLKIIVLISEKKLLHDRFFGPTRGEYIRYALLGILCILLINSIWITASYIGHTNMGGGFTAQDMQAFKPWGTPLQAFFDTVTLRSFWIQSLYFKRLAETQFLFSFIPVAIVLLVGVYFSIKQRKFRELIAVLLLFSCAGFLALGVATPFSAPVTLWLTTHVPFYIGLRDASKWVGVLLGVYALFFSIGLARIIRLPLVRIFNIGFGILFVSLVLFLSPYSLWGFGGTVTSVEYPEPWYQANVTLNKNNCFSGRTLVLPWHLYMSYSWFSGRAGNIGEKFFDCPLVSPTNIEIGGVSDSSGTVEGVLIPEWLSSGNKTLLEKLNVTSIIVFHEVDWQGYNEALQKLPYLSKVDSTSVGRGDITIYKVQ